LFTRIFPFLNSKTTIGAKGENLCVSFLKANGFRILARNFKAKRWGEIDIIAKDHDQIAFIEVKTRVGHQQTTPTDAITQKKKAALVRTAQEYLKSTAQENLPIRIDVITILYSDSNDLNPIVTHFENIFSP
jgi:putative endonuclease